MDSGTTTMKFGATRYGPRPFSTRQFGKYEVFTSTGTPNSLTRKDMESAVVETP